MTLMAFCAYTPRVQYTKIGASLSRRTFSTFSFTSGKGTFLAPGTWPPSYSILLRTSSSIPPGVMRHLFTPTSMSGV